MKHQCVSGGVEKRLLHAKSIVRHQTNASVLLVRLKVIYLVAGQFILSTDFTFPQGESKL